MDLRVSLPTSTAVGVAGLILATASIEIDAVAFVPKAAEGPDT
jgi:enamine deaminase RidA (YjgF/YER057c/UK114 family)